MKVILSEYAKKLGFKTVNEVREQICIPHREDGYDTCTVCQYWANPRDGCSLLDYEEEAKTR